MKKYTKKYISDEIKKCWNSTGYVGNIKVAVVGWHDNSYKIIDEKQTFEDIVHFASTPIESFNIKSLMVDRLYSLLNH